MLISKRNKYNIKNYQKTVNKQNKADKEIKQRDGHFYSWKSDNKAIEKKNNRNRRTQIAN